VYNLVHTLPCRIATIYSDVSERIHAYSDIQEGEVVVLPESAVDRKTLAALKCIATAFNIPSEIIYEKRTSSESLGDDGDDADDGDDGAAAMPGSP